jgi:pimeloyl-ACP methyl ester carboxylesterase
MPYAKLHDVTLYYEVSGPTAFSQPLVLIHGLGAQMIAWHEGFCRALEGAGFTLIRFDNRDVGLSTKFDDAQTDMPYTLLDMTQDVIGLLDHLKLEKAHLAGQSMGGMIAQQVAISFPQRVRSMVSIYSVPSMEFQTADEEVWRIRGEPPATSREEAIAQYIRRERLSGLDGFDEDSIRRFAAAVYDRSYCPRGAERQLKAVSSAKDRRPALAALRMPVSVIHGLDDRLLSFHGGVATALAIPGAELHLYSGMGHQLPPRLYPDFVRVISRTAKRAEN